MFGGGNVQSTDYVINNVQLKFDIITLDNAWDNEYAAGLMQEKNTYTLEYIHHKQSRYHEYGGEYKHTEVC